MRNTPWQLRNLVNTEKNLIDYHVNALDKIEITISVDGQSVELNVNDKIYFSLLDRPVIHQLASKVIGYNTAYENAYSYWKNQIEYNRTGFLKLITEGLKKSNCIIKSFRNGRIYGIVTPYFREINQIEFRDKFIKELKSNNEFSDDSRFIVDGYGRFIEIFKPKFSIQNFEYRYCLIHGRNNGYSAIKVHWARKVIVCSNGLTSFDGPQFKVIHNCDVDYKTFVHHSVDTGISNYQKLNKQLQILSGIPLSQEEVNLQIAETKIEAPLQKKITDRYNIESKETGMNMWSYSQALTWLGEHDRNIGAKNRFQLKSLGTKVLDSPELV